MPTRALIIGLLGIGFGRSKFQGGATFVPSGKDFGGLVDWRVEWEERIVPRELCPARIVPAYLFKAHNVIYTLGIILARTGLNHIYNILRQKAQAAKSVSEREREMKNIPARYFNVILSKMQTSTCNSSQPNVWQA
jgi:hypothetical protein